MSAGPDSSLAMRRQQAYAAFAAAWAAHDIDGVMAQCVDDVVYAASVGPEPGLTLRGREDVRRGVVHMLAVDNAFSMRVGVLTLDGERGFVEWSYEVPSPNGGQHTLRGIDIITFRGDRIARKDAFRKAFAP